MARVIFWMFLTDAMRPLMSFWLAIRHPPDWPRRVCPPPPPPRDRPPHPPRRALVIGIARVIRRVVAIIRVVVLMLRRGPAVLLVADAVGLALFELVALFVEVRPEVVDGLGDRLAQLLLHAVVPVAAVDVVH